MLGDQSRCKKCVRINEQVQSMGQSQDFIGGNGHVVEPIVAILFAKSFGRGGIVRALVACNG